MSWLLLLRIPVLVSLAAAATAVVWAAVAGRE
jgi:hypothetical protein